MEVPWGRERLRIDVLREGGIRIKISRGGVFDERPTFAVIEDASADFEVDGTTLRTAALEVDTTTLNVRRRDGSPVIESIEPYATLNHPFWIKRRRGAVHRVDRAVRDAQRRVLDQAQLSPGGRDLRPRREERAPQPPRSRVHA